MRKKEGCLETERSPKPSAKPTIYNGRNIPAESRKANAQDSARPQDCEKLRESTRYDRNHATRHPVLRPAVCGTAITPASWNRLKEARSSDQPRAPKRLTAGMDILYRRKNTGRRALQKSIQEPPRTALLKKREWLAPRAAFPARSERLSGHGRVGKADLAVPSPRPSHTRRHRA